MVLDLDLFRPEKGGDPEKIRVNQKKRFDDESLVDKVVDNDLKWRQCKLKAESVDPLNANKERNNHLGQMLIMKHTGV